MIANANSDNITSTDRTRTGPAADGSTSSPVTHLPWTSITDRPPVLVSLGALADGPGVLRNDGSGGLSWDPSAGSVDWADITGTPTDLAGYGITDAVDTGTFTGFVSTLFPIAFSGSWTDLNSTPTDLAGYGITDAVDTTTFSGFVSSLFPIAFSGSAFDVSFSSSTGLFSTDVSSALDELNTLIGGGGGGVVADGDYGDVTVSGTGTVWTIDAATITPAKITNRAALSVFGRSANSSGVGADIAAATDGFVLRRSGTTLGFGTIGDSSISALAFSKLTGLPTTRSGYGITDAQPLDAELTAIASLVSAADKLPYFTGSGSASLADFTPFARTLLDDTTQAAMQSTLGVAPAFTVGTSLSYAANVLNAIQGIRTVDTPQFAGLGLGTAPGAVLHVIDNAANGFILERTSATTGKWNQLITAADGNWNLYNQATSAFALTISKTSLAATFGGNVITPTLFQAIGASAGAQIRVPAGGGGMTLDASTGTTNTGMNVTYQRGGSPKWNLGTGISVGADIFELYDRANSLSTLTIAPATGNAVHSGSVSAKQGIFAGQASGSYAGILSGNGTTGGSFGVFINAGTNSSDYSLQILNAAQSKGYLYIRGDGPVSIGSAATSGKLSVYGNANANTGFFEGISTSGQSYGIHIAAGTTAADYSLRVTNQSQSIDVLKMSGDGANNYRGSSGGTTENYLSLANTAGTSHVLGFYASNGAAYGPVSYSANTHTFLTAGTQALKLFSGTQAVFAGLTSFQAGVEISHNNPIYFDDSGAIARRGGLWAGTNAYWGDIDNTQATQNLLFLAGGAGVINFYTNGVARMTIGGTGNIAATGNYISAAPAGGTAAAWRFGIPVSAAVSFVTTQYIQLDVNGTLYKLALAA